MNLTRIRALEKGNMEPSEVETSTRARGRERESSEGNEGQRRALAEHHFFARAGRDFFTCPDFVQICHRISLEIFGESVYKCLLLSLTLSYIFLYQPYPSLLPSLSTNLEDDCIFATKNKTFYQNLFFYLKLNKQVDNKIEGKTNKFR